MAWFYALLLFCNSTSGKTVGFVRKQLGLGIRSTFRLCDKLRIHFAFYDRPEKLGGPGKTVYVDEVRLNFVGGRKKGRNAGILVLGLACEGKVLSGIIPDRTKATLVKHITRLIAPGSTIVTDGYRSYHGLSRLGWSHIMVNHSRAFHNFEGVTTNEIETYWNSVKRSLRLYSNVSAANLWKYLAEIEFRYNHRNRFQSRFDIAISRFPEITPQTTDTIRRRYCWD